MNLTGILFRLNMNFINILKYSFSSQVRNSQKYIELFKDCYSDSDFAKIKTIANDLNLGKQFEVKQKQNFVGLINYIVKNIEPSNDETNLSSQIGLVSFLVSVLVENFG